MTTGAAANDQSTTGQLQGRWVEYRPVVDLPDDPRNSKGHDIGVIGDSMARHGFVELPTIDERTGLLVAGHGRKETLLSRKDAGLPPPDGIVVDSGGEWCTPVVRGWASRNDDEAEAYLIGSNQSTIAGGWLNEQLARALDRLDKSVGLLGVGFSSDDAKDMLARYGPPPSIAELRDRHGEPDESAMWPVLRFKVPPELRTRYMALIAGQEGGDDVLFGLVVGWAEKGKR